MQARRVVVSMSILAGLCDIARNARWADGVDVLLFAVVLYFALRAVEWTIGRAGWALIAVVAGLDWLARSFDMFLISWLLHAFFAVGALALAIVFQGELRRLFRYLEGLLRHGWPRRALHPADDCQVVADAAFALAEQRNGALIVLAGRESLEGLVEGGVPLGGRLSAPLLLSLFDPHSPGHDGAAVVEQGHVTRFSTHLPLALDERRARGLGTRHRSALGLAERCDALVVVVSEERGAVAVACRGKLELAPTPEALQQRITGYWQTRASVGESSARPQPSEATPRWRLKLAALAMSMAAWLMFAYQVGSVERTVTATIEYRNVPESFAAAVADYPQAQVTLRGSPQAFRLHDSSEVDVTLDVSGLSRGQFDYDLSAANVEHPADLRVVDVLPHAVSFKPSAHGMSPRTAARNRGEVGG